ncbi:hypothetical protein H257_12038 [Aphanomyces astaci]|uniref:Transposase Tc1-like domain-containing protein n=1 Tax=Aphanomyces astaci TaxID=112090 RepID=W4FZU0_APHAT|nr:hypothetical protein H257_12038 [Aphanomyces astaci]ETV72992.1 hypothetical protein H257_12038 [Aphanomyces astaci]|eukprot:XP_009837441.1 hypothetical protein H257_12038 [Aphanomyces astaci]
MIWQRGRATALPGSRADVKSRMTNCGRTKSYTVNEIEQCIKATPLAQRQTYRALAAAIGVSTWTIWNFIQSKWVTRRPNWTKPRLKPEHMKQRADFCKAILNDYSKHNDNELYNAVHIDEKWFYITKIRRRFYLWHDEENMPRHVQSKSHITKVMFLVAVARPRSDWDGKFGCWPFVVSTPAQRTSANRPAGALVTKSVYRSYLVEKVIPSIKEMWRWLTDDNEGVVYLQQDNARAHVAADEPTVAAAAEHAAFRIQVRNQPPQSVNSSTRVRVNDRAGERPLRDTARVPRASRLVARPWIEDALRGIPLDCIIWLIFIHSHTVVVLKHGEDVLGHGPGACNTAVTDETLDQGAHSSGVMNPGLVIRRVGWRTRDRQVPCGQELGHDSLDCAGTMPKQSTDNTRDIRATLLTKGCLKPKNVQLLLVGQAAPTAHLDEFLHPRYDPRIHARHGKFGPVTAVMFRSI